jgi:hypothetical protein
LGLIDNLLYFIGRQVQPRSQPTQIIDARAFGRIGVVKTNTRDDKKRATHNEVERRRRDKINGWISKLSKIVPTCTDESTNKGQVLKVNTDHLLLLLLILPLVLEMC